MLFGLGLVGLAEVVCATFGWGDPDTADDPFVGFSQVYPLFVLNEATDRYEIPESRLAFFRPESFPREKPQDGFRIFCLGGSTVQGRPYSIETAFTTWLEINLQAADPSFEWDVINCGGISYASYRLVPILRECLQYEPDLFILCTGHNEFLEERSYPHLKQMHPAWFAVQQQLSRSHLYTLARAALKADTEPAERETLKSEVDALLDYQGGLEAYVRDPQWAEGVVTHYELNVRRMLAIARAAGVPVLLIHPPSNLSDCPPFKSLPADDLSDAARQRCEALLERARVAQAGSLEEAIALYRQALEIDGQSAITYYELGKCLEASHRYPEAREMLVAARDRDICPLRMTTPLETALRRVAQDRDVPLLDAHALLEAESSSGILGDFLLVDHIHPSIQGHQMIAERLMPMLVSLGMATRQQGWQERAEAARTAHFESLDRMYFLSARRRLDGLRAWTEGRVDGPPLSQRTPPEETSEP